MNFETKQARLIRALKLALVGICMSSIIFCFVIMFFEYEKVSAFFSQPNVVGVLGLAVGLIIGFTLGVFAMYFATELNTASEKKMQSEFFKTPIIKNGPAQNSKTAKCNSVAPTSMPQQKPVQKNVPSQKAQKPIITKAELSKKIFDMLEEFDDSDNLQSNSYDVEN